MYDNWAIVLFVFAMLIMACAAPDSNTGLSDNQKIRAVSMSVGLAPTAADDDEFLSAIEETKAAGIFDTCDN